MKFYAYLWLREDGTPEYAGKGTGKRAFVRGSHHLKPPTDRTRILILARASEAEAFETEKELIANWGRKDLGTGCLRNFTDGGDGVSGLQHTEDAKRRMSVGHLGKTTWNKGLSPSPEYSAALSAGQRKRTTGRIGRKGWKLSLEDCQKQSERKKGHLTSDETKQKIRLSHLGRKASPELRKKLSESHKGYVPWNKGKTGGSWSGARRKAQEAKQHGKL